MLKYAGFNSEFRVQREDAVHFENASEVALITCASEKLRVFC
jgi:hypothetical protein